MRFAVKSLCGRLVATDSCRRWEAAGSPRRRLCLTAASEQIRPPEHSAVKVFDRRAKLYQRERAARAPDVHLYDYLKEEVGYRLADRVFDIKRQFKLAANIGCGRGYVSRHVEPEYVDKLVMCDTSPAWLEQAAAYEGMPVEKIVVDEEGDLPFDESSLDLVISSLCLHWVNDLPGMLTRVHRCLRNDGVLMASMFGCDTLYELRSSLQLANLERKGGVAAHISPFTEIRDVGALLTRAGFTMLTIDTDEIVVNYPTMLELLWDLKGMGESNAAYNRTLHLGRERLLAAAAIYDQLYGKEADGKRMVPATFQVIYMLGWKPDASQPTPLPRGSGEVSLKDLYRLEEVIKDSKKVPLDQPGDKHERN